MKQAREREHLYFIWFNAIGITTATCFGYLNIVTGMNFIAGLVELVVAVIALLNLIIVLKFKNFQIGICVLLLIMLLLLLTLSVTGGLGKTGLLWYFTYPVLTFGLTNSRRALFWIAGLLLSTISLNLYFAFQIPPSTIFSMLEIQQLVVAMSIVSALMYLYKSQQEYEEAQLAEKVNEISLMNSILEHEQLSESNLQQELLRFKLAVENAHDMIVITDKDGYLLYANPALERTTGFTRKEVEGIKAGVLWGNQMSKEFYQRLWRTIKQEKKAYIGEFQNLRKNGQKYIALATISPILGLDQEVQYFIGVERDITKEKELEDQKNEFISFSAHQLRTPVTSLKWYTDILLDGTVGQLTPQQVEVAQKLQTTVARIQELTHEFLDISRLENGKLIIKNQLTSIPPLLQSVVEETKHYFEAKQQSVEITCSESDFSLNIDPAIFRQILINLLTNASKYSHEHAVIYIRCHRTSDAFQIAVQDQGIGISSEDEKKIFAKFFRASNARETTASGNGLGLFFIKKVIETVGGKITFTSKLGEGTTFTIHIPTDGWKETQGQA